jgi:protocatechuate 3,4-dioxygenase beta subunit
VCLTLVAAAPLASAQEVRQQIQVVGPGEGAPLQMLPPGRQAKTGTGRLRGRVVATDTGSAIRRAQVRISGPDIGTKTALTDVQGRYEFRDLPAGRFNVSVSKSGFVTMQYGQNRPFEPGRPIELAEAQAMDKADVSLPRGSVLAGHIVDEFGEAVADAEVVAMRMQFQNGKRRLVPSGRNAQTNDLGQFRIYGLPPGEYYVSASLRNINAMVFDMLGGAGGPVGSNQSAGYASTYYPGTPNPAEAQRVALSVGQELASVDIQLQPVRLAKITGTAVGSDGKPMGGAMVMLMPSMRDAMQFLPGGTSRTNADGQFTLSGVTPGEYSLQVQSMGALMTAAGNAMTLAFSVNDRASGAPQTPPQEREFAMATVTVAGEDISGMVVVATRGAKASGTIAFEGGVKPEGVGGIRVTAPSVDADGSPMPGLGAAIVKDTGTFDVDGLIGARVFRAANLPKGWVLKSVTLNGEDVTDKGIEFKPGQDVSGIEIELTSRSTSINGSVTDDRGNAVKDYTVVIFAEDEAKWALPMNRWMSSARPDQDGRFKFSNLPPGPYYAIAVDYVAAGEWQDPEWLSRASKKATRITLDDGGAKNLDLKLAGS